MHAPAPNRRRLAAAVGFALAPACAPLRAMELAQTSFATFDVSLVDVDPTLGLETATIDVDAVVLDRCGPTAVIPVGRPVDALGGDDGFEVYPGGYCAVRLLLDPGVPGLSLSGATGADEWTVEIEVGAIAVLEPFELGADHALIGISGAELDLAQERLDPVLADVWRDEDGDGVVTPGDELLTGG